MKPDDLRERTAAVAREMLAATAGTEEQDEPLFGDNSRRRIIDKDLRTRFLEVRTSMYRKGMIDPVLIRFDSYTVPQATSREIAERLKEIADTM